MCRDSLSDITYEVPIKLKITFGYLAYLLKGAEKLPQVKSIQMRIEYEGGVFEGEASMFFVALTNTVGGLSKIDPNMFLGMVSLRYLLSRRLIYLKYFKYSAWFYATGNISIIHKFFIHTCPMLRMSR